VHIFQKAWECNSKIVVCQWVVASSNYGPRVSLLIKTLEKRRWSNSHKSQQVKCGQMVNLSIKLYFFGMVQNLKAHLQITHKL
jgi:hypothetical protein